MSGLEGLGIVANVIAVVDLSLKVVSWCSKYAQDVKNSSDGRARLLQAAITLHYESGKIHDLLTGRNGSKLKASQKLAHAMGSSEVQLRELESLLSDKNNCSSLKWPLRKEKVESAIRNIESATKTLLEVLQIDTTGIILDIDGRTEAGQRRAVIDQLPYVSDAVWDSHAEEHNATCLENTRRDILRDINDWVEDTTDQAKTVFWLNGMAGTGKSTISRTIARSLSEAGRLGASFFFKRGETNRGSISKFVTTIARQLATNQSAIEPYIHEAVLQEPTITSKAIRNQFERLIVEPLTRCSNNSHKDTPISIIVDALDECESDADIHLIINLFSGTRGLRHPRPRIFVTSRPDLPVRLGFKDVEGTYQDLILHEIPSQVIENDIAIFLQHETELIKACWDTSVPERRRLPINWPDSDCIRLLTKRATPLFIFAATVCRFIADRRHGDPEEQLQRFLENLDEDTSSRMDLTYKPVLSQLLGSNCSKRKKELIISEFRRVVGTIINLASPLSPSALSRLLNIDQKIIDTRLDLLHSVLSVPDSSEAPIRMFHLSFRDYLINSDIGENQFGIDEKQSAKDLVKDCFRVMGSLEPDVCHLGIPGKPRSMLKSEFVDACIPPEVQYACIYWIYHLLIAGVHDRDAEAILEFLQKHLLHWVEAMTLLGRVYQVTGLMRDLRSMLNAKVGCKFATTSILQTANAAHQSKIDKMLIDFLDDAIRFVDTDIEILNSCPLQIYSSALTFAPTNSIIRKTFAVELPGYVEFADTTLGAVAFSQDSTFLWACSLDGKVKAWNVETKNDLIRFSSDGKLLTAPAAEVSAVVIWNLQSAENLWKLDRNDGSLPENLVFSPDSKLLAIEYNDRSILVWDVRSGACTANIASYNNFRNATIAFSPDLEYLLLAVPASNVVGSTIEGWSLRTEMRGQLCISGPFDHQIQLWDWATFLNEPSEKALLISSIALSHDASLAVASFGHKELRVWDTTTGEKIWDICARDHSSVHSFEVSVNSQHIAVSYWHQDDSDSTEIWKQASGTCNLQQTLEVAPGRCLQLSPSGNNILRWFSAGIEILNCDTGELVHQLKLDLRGIGEVSMAISDDSYVLALGFKLTVQIWDPRSIARMHTWDTEFHRDLTLSSTGTLLASRTYRQCGYMRLWNWETGETVAEIEVLHGDWQFRGFLSDNSGVRTNYGDIILKPGTTCRQYLKPTFTLRKGWIQWKGHNLVKLPTEYEGAMTAITATASEITAIIGLDTQRVIIIKLSENEELRCLLPLIGESA
ncbi:hypothetical protein FGADI_3304 [Fusarium gaditjirri]|uniref:Nephrocystin 3-like N-terminal domain-containing protein n=1 Tax=Fusarium gaditjirri TaxID=282569 RepID=A0A8H4TGB0_9HYPO|nr:hypothetical protein FGADI_3304 [Fusarium gaditjirri]